MPRSFGAVPAAAAGNSSKPRSCVCWRRATCPCGLVATTRHKQAAAPVGFEQIAELALGCSLKARQHGRVVAGNVAKYQARGGFAIRDCQALHGAHLFTGMEPVPCQATPTRQRSHQCAGGHDGHMAAAGGGSWVRARGGSRPPPLHLIALLRFDKATHVTAQEPMQLRPRAADRVMRMVICDVRLSSGLGVLLRFEV